MIDERKSKFYRLRRVQSSLLAVSILLGASWLPAGAEELAAEQTTQTSRPSPEFDLEVSETDTVEPTATSSESRDPLAGDQDTDAGRKTGLKKTTASDKLIVDDIQIEGNRLVSTEDITSVLKTKRGDKFDRQQLMQDLQAINQMGYFDDKSLQVVPKMTSSGILLRIRVQENAPITQFSFHGNQVVSTEEISKLFADQLGKPQSLMALSKSIDEIEQMYHDKGFVLARVTDVKDFPDGSVSLKINEGEIAKIEIAGNRKTKDFIIKNAIKLGEGQVYNERTLSHNLRKLYANGYFQDIRRSLAPSSEDPSKFVLKVEVDEKRTGSVGVGGGVDSIAGPFGSLSFSDANFMGRGQIVSFNSQIGSGMFGNINNSINNGGNTFLPTQRTYQIEASFVEPHLKGTNTSLSASGFGRNYASLLVDQAQQQTIGGNLTLSRPFKKNFRLNLGLLGENTRMQDIGNFFGGASALDTIATNALALGKASTAAGAQQLAAQVRDEQLRGGTYFSVKPSITYDTRDAYIDPTRGTFAKLSAGPSLGLDGASFAKLGASVSKFVPLGKNTTLALNAQGGTAFGGLPQFAQYRLGGWNGVRGYRMFSDLGTGTSMLMATAEVRTRLPLPKSKNKIVQLIDKHVKAAAFFDVGRVSGNTFTNQLYARSSLGASAGIGLRFKMPMIGLVRVDYGVPFFTAALGNWTPRLTVGFGEKF